MGTNLTLLSPIEQIKVQNLFLPVETEEKSFFQDDFTICEFEEISLDVSVEIDIDYHPDYGRSVKKIKIHFLSGYDNRECEDLQMNSQEIREIEEYLKENLIIKIN